jgi:hypothetical protein
MIINDILLKYYKIFLLLIHISALMGAGCNGNTSKLAVADEFVAVPVIGPDYRKQGRVPYDTFEGELGSSTGCKIFYTHYKPLRGSTQVLVMLGHGFMRSRKRMASLARHLAGWGLPVANVEFCNSKLWAGNHDRNGADMVAVAHRLHAGKNIYTGYSAGGLAAMAAAALDKNALAFLGLDMVDNQGLGKKTAPNLTLPFYGLIAAPSVCNANNNGMSAFDLAPHALVIKVEDSSHCHFEFPVDRKCSIVCGTGEEQFSTEVIQQTILGLTTAFLLWQTGIDANGETWWLDNQQNYKILRAAGYIIEP